MPSVLPRLKQTRSTFPCRQDPPSAVSPTDQKNTKKNRCCFGRLAWPRTASAKLSRRKNRDIPLKLKQTCQKPVDSSHFFDLFRCFPKKSAHRPFFGNFPKNGGILPFVGLSPLLASTLSAITPRRSKGSQFKCAPLKPSAKFQNLCVETFDAR